MPRVLICGASPQCSKKEAKSARGERRHRQHLRCVLSPENDFGRCAVSVRKLWEHGNVCCPEMKARSRIFLESELAFGRISSAK